MSCEALVYARLSASTALQALIGNRLYPSVPTENTQLPFVVYTVTSTEPQVHAQGDAGLTRYAVDVDIWAVNLDTVLAALDAVKAQLHGVRWGSVQGSFLTTQATDEQELGHHGQASYSVWVAG